MDIRAGVNFELSDDTIFLPRSICDKYAEIGITSVFPWQAACLKLPGVLEGTRNLVYCAPTSAGKTLVAELITLKRILTTSKKAIIILPYVSVSREKVISLQHIFDGVNVRVGGFMGGVSPAGGLASVRVAVCTIEKANNLVNRLIEDDRLSDLGVVVVDEMHLIGDQHRGYLLELLLTKLLLCGNKWRNGEESCIHNAKTVEDLHIQIVGMSASLPTLPVLGSWLDAAVYITDFRPIPLTEFVYTKEVVYRVTAGEGDVCERLESINCGEYGLFNASREKLPIADNDDGVFDLCFGTLLSGFAALVFCSTKHWCEQLATSMAGHVYNLICTLCQICRLVKPYLKMQGEWPVNEASDCGWTLRKQLNEVDLSECLQHLKRCPAGLDPVLSQCIPFGVAFHHAGASMSHFHELFVLRNGFSLTYLGFRTAILDGTTLHYRVDWFFAIYHRHRMPLGLTIEERDIIELAFRKGHLRLLIATSTLSSGVNLPARRVIIRTPFFHGQTLGYLDYKQMVGRAGRKGIDVRGESVLICKSKDLPKVRHLLSCGMPPVASCLLKQSGTPESSLCRAILEVITSGIVESVSDAKGYMEATLLSACLKASSKSKSTPISRSHKSSMSTGSDETDSLLSACLDVLTGSELVLRPPGDEETLKPTQLGRAVLASALGPVDGLTVFAELSRASRSIALDTDLHLVYLVTPIYLNLDTNLDWSRYLEIYQSLSPPERRVAELVGVEERDLVRCLSGAAMVKRTLPQMQRFYLALALHRLVCEDGLTEVAERFNINRGLLQSLMQQASTYAGNWAVFSSSMVTVFCNRLGWIHMERLLEGFQMRLLFGVSNELIDLLRLSPLLNTSRSRILYQAGFTSIASVARARPKQIERVLQRANPFIRSVELFFPIDVRMTEVIGDVDSFVAQGDSMCASDRHLASPVVHISIVFSDKNRNQVRSPRSIMLPDGSVVSEMELALLLTCKAQDVLQNDLVCNYGVDLPADVAVSPFTSSSKRRKLSHLTCVEMEPASTLSAGIDTPGKKSSIKDSSISRASTSHSVRGRLSTTTKFALALAADVRVPAIQSTLDHDCICVSSDPHAACSQVPLFPRFEKGSTSSPIPRGHSPANTCGPLTNSVMLMTKETLQLNDTMTFSMMERFAESVNTELAADTVSNEDIFSSQISNSSTGEDSSKDATPISALVEQYEPVGASTCRPLFSLIDVTRTPQLWMIFKREFESFLDSNTDVGIHWLAVQPHWQILASREACKEAMKSNATFIWHDGCGGRRSHGSTCSGVCLQLMGLTISSSRLRPQTVFWLPFHVQDVDVLKSLKRLLARPRLGLVVSDLKWWLRVSIELLNFKVDFVERFHDPGTQAWLENPDAGRPRLVDVVPDASAVVNALFSMGYRLDGNHANVCVDPPTQLCNWVESELASTSSPLLLESYFSPPILNTAAQCFLLSLVHPPSSPSFALQLELSIASLLAKSESHGFDHEQLFHLVLNYSILSECRTELKRVCDSLVKLAHALVGCAFDLGSPREVADILYNRLHLPVYTSLAAELAASKRVKKSHCGIGLRTRPRQLPTNNQTLSHLAHAHPLPTIVIEWRRINGVLEKGFSGIARACEMALDRHDVAFPSEVRVGCIYRTFSANGRIISTYPNLQAVPKVINFSWSGLLHRPPPMLRNDIVAVSKVSASVEWPETIADVLRPFTEKADLGLRPRSAFGAAKGSLLVSADFNHLELRILVHLSQDSVLVPMLQSTNQDVFKELAAHWLNHKDVSLVTDEERQQAKRLCYAVIYGMGASSLASEIGVTPSEAQTLIDKFMTSFYGVAEFIRRTIETVRDQGFVRTLGGRLRKIHGFKSSKSNSSPSKCPSPCRFSSILNGNLPEFCNPEKATNVYIFPLGGASGRQQHDPRQCSGYRQVGNATGRIGPAARGKCVTPEASVPVICNILRREMPRANQAFKMNIPLPVKVKVGSNWSDLREVGVPTPCSYQRSNPVIIASAHANPSLKSNGHSEVVQIMLWGLIPSFVSNALEQASSGGKFATANARAENILERPSYMDCIKHHRRCVVVVQGFYEWKKLAGGNKTPFFISLPGKTVRFLHQLINKLKLLELKIYPVTPLMNSISFDCPQCIEPLDNSKPSIQDLSKNKKIDHFFTMKRKMSESTEFALGEESVPKKRLEDL
ncbi:unnamed protein product [Hydatigera taeniaeformis]|uniref:Abasic site processing protein HMCES n=1 Tax=Hydatigena taeniaeformis TaxID=6205 RepID=A0A158RDY2_HYDTA|nr:unnamed protein product [Hydatigera taeniaeformis]